MSGFSSLYFHLCLLNDAGWLRVILKSCGNNRLFYFRIYSTTYLRFQLINFPSHSFFCCHRERQDSCKNPARVKKARAKNWHKQHGTFFIERHLRQLHECFFVFIFGHKAEMKKREYFPSCHLRAPSRTQMRKSRYAPAVDLRDVQLVDKLMDSLSVKLKIPNIRCHPGKATQTKATTFFLRKKWI